MLVPYLKCASWNSSSGIHGIICAKSELFHIRIFFLWVWSFLYQELADGAGEGWDRKGLLGEENMLTLIPPLRSTVQDKAFITETLYRTLKRQKTIGGT